MSQAAPNAKATVVTDDGKTHVWRTPWTTWVFGTAFAVYFVIASASYELGFWLWAVPLLVSLVLWGLLVVRPRVELTQTDLKVRGIRESSIPLSEVAEAVSDYSGFHIFRLLDNGTQAHTIFRTASLGTTNAMRWLDRTSRGDKVAALVTLRAARVNGSPVKSVVLHRGRATPAETPHASGQLETPGL